MVLFFTMCLPKGIVCMGDAASMGSMAVQRHRRAQLPGRSRHQCKAVPRVRTQPMHSCTMDMRPLLKSIWIHKAKPGKFVCVYGWEASFCALSALPLRTLMPLWLRYTFAFQCHQRLHGVKSGGYARFLKEKNYLFVLASFFLVTSSPAHCELSLKGVALIPRSLSPCAWLPIASPTARRPLGGVIQILCHAIILLHSRPPLAFSSPLSPAAISP